MRGSHLVQLLFRFVQLKPSVRLILYIRKKINMNAPIMSLETRLRNASIKPESNKSDTHARVTRHSLIK